jgi:hypothetical protein
VCVFVFVGEEEGEEEEEKRRRIWVGTGRKGIGFHELLKKKSCSSLLFTQQESSLKP